MKCLPLALIDTVRAVSVSHWHAAMADSDRRNRSGRRAGGCDCLPYCTARDAGDSYEHRASVAGLIRDYLVAGYRPDVTC